MTNTLAATRNKVIVIDDDPTGSQTVHSCPLVTCWDIDTLSAAINDPAPIFFILTNTRSMTPEQAAEVTRSVCQTLRQALDRSAAGGVSVRAIFVSRSDSTLRGHYPLETDVIASELGPFDAHFLVPAFFEGGRMTRGGHHYLLIDGVPIPTHETEFAQDRVFGYRHSYLPDYVEEKTGGRIAAAQVEKISLADLRAGCLPRLRALRDPATVVVDAVQQSDLDSLGEAVRTAVDEGKRFLFRSAASLLTSLARLPPQPVAPEQMSGYARGPVGVVIAGSHVRRTTDQLRGLLADAATVPIEVNVDECTGPEADGLLWAIIQRVEKAFDAHKTAVVFTSRSERHFADGGEQLRFGAEISAFLMRIVQNLPRTTGFLISKGGITSHNVLSIGLGLKTCRVLGQVLAGCSVVRSPPTHPRFPDLPIVIFPGNVGDETSLLTVFKRLSGGAQGEAGGSPGV